MPRPDVEQFVVQHLYPDTLRLLVALHPICPIRTVIGIGYSGEPDVVSALRAMGIEVLTPAHEDLVEAIDGALGDALDVCEDTDKRLLIHEVGGRTIRVLHERHAHRTGTVIGAAEITKQGVWAAEALGARLAIPQANCATTRLKAIEGPHVGDAVVAALDRIMRERGQSIAGRAAEVHGFGWIGAGCAHALRLRGAVVAVSDPDPIRQLAASLEGFALVGGPARAPDIVLGASGRTSIGPEAIRRAADGALLVSGGSGDHEIDLEAVRGLAGAPARRVHRVVEALELDDGRTLHLVNQGYPVNFTQASVPDEIVEFLLAELVLCVEDLLGSTLGPGIHPLAPEREALVARTWLELRRGPVRQGTRDPGRT